MSAKQANSMIDYDTVVLYVALVHSSIFPYDIKQKRDLFFKNVLIFSDVY